MNTMPYGSLQEASGTDSASEGSTKKKGRTVAVTTEDMQKRKNDVKARKTLLLALPDEHQLRFNNGNEATKKIKKNQLKQQYGNFKAEGSETLEQTFNRLQAIVSHLEFMDVEIEQDDLNQKFLTSLAPKWLMYIIMWRNRSDHDMMTKNSSGKEDVNTASFSTASTQVSPASANVVAASFSHDTVCLSHVEARLVEFKNQEIKFCEKIRGLEFKAKSKDNRIERLTKELEELKKDKEGLDSKLTGFQSASKDLDTHLGSQRSSPSIESNSNDLQSSNSSVSENGELSSSILSKHVITFVKAADSPTGNSQNVIDDKRYWNSGCSRYMTGNILYLSDYEPYDGGYVSFGQGGGKIPGKDFKLNDDTNVLLRTPRQHNMYYIDLNNIVPHKDLTCLVAKASADESILWHKRLVVAAGTSSTNFSGTKDAASQDVKKDVGISNPTATSKNPLADQMETLAVESAIPTFRETHLESSTSNAQDACNADAPESSGISNPTATSKNPLADQMETLAVESAIPTVSSLVPTACSDDSPEPSSDTRLISKRVTSQDDTPSLDNILNLSNRFEDILGVKTNTDDTHGVEADLGNIENNISAVLLLLSESIRTIQKEELKKIYDALKDSSWVEAMQEELLQFKIQNVWILVDCPERARPIGTKWVLKNKKDKRGIVIRNKVRLVAQGHTHEEGINYEEVFTPVTRIEAIKLFLAYASFMGFTVYQMDVKSAFLYGTIDEEVYVMQPPRFQDPEFPARVYKVEKAMLLV
nr:putative ribonuclease H-like domain-containing protein [Tanacetum cinerariifolium]